MPERADARGVVRHNDLGRPRPARLAWSWPRRSMRPVLVTVLALGAGSLAASAVNEADAAREAWGPTRPAAVARRAIEAGHTLTADDVATIEVPAAALPDDIVDDPIGRVATSALFAHEWLTAARVAPAGAAATFGIPPGSVAVALPVDDRTPALHADQHVDVYGSDGRPVVSHALVLSVADRQVTIAVPEREARTAATAILDGALVVVVNGPR